MPEHNITRPEINRDGTSQADRFLPALNPDSVLVDERSLKELLSFAREYGKELRYFNEKNEATGDWSAFIDDDIDLDQLVSFIQNPSTVSAEQQAQFSRPHLSLFLSFLTLLQKAQEQLNTFTQRHLDFYYQDVLRLQKKAGIADRVNVLLQPQTQVDQVLVPAGTALSAGQDASGKDLIYQTDEDLVVSQAQVASLKTVYAEKKITGITEAREAKEGTRQERFVQMLGIALGHPLPGDALPKNDILQSDKTKTVVDFDYLTRLREVTAFAKTDLFMPLFDLRSLMKFKRRRDQSTEEWSEINGYLQIAARKKRNNPNFTFEPVDPRDFAANLIAALKGEPDYAGITEVSSIDHVYIERNRTEVQTFIQKKLYFDDVNNFLAMMRLKLKIDKEWEGINQLLEAAGQLKRKETSYRLMPDDPTDFTANLKKAIGEPFSSNVSGRFDSIDIDHYYTTVEQVEQDFYMSAESFDYFISAGTKEKPGIWEWQKIDEILLAAHRQKIYAMRRTTLEKLRKTQGMTAMLHLALGEETNSAESDPLSRLSNVIEKKDDTAFLETIHNTAKSSENVTAKAWTRVYKIVELAQRHVENFQPPTPYKKTWINVFPAPDATQALALTVKDEETSNPRWRTFGQPESPASSDTPPDAVLGWGMSSPLFAMAEGTRVLTLTLGFDAASFFSEKLKPLFPNTQQTVSGEELPFQLDISTEKGWITPDKLEIHWGDYGSLSQTDDSTLQAMQWTLYFSAAAAPICAAAETLAQNPWPSLRLMLRQIWDSDHQCFVTRYAPFMNLKLLKTHVRVSVTGLNTLDLENDQGTLNAKKPFEPFTRTPAVGSRLIIGHPELSRKRLESVAFQVEWMSVPDQLGSHYKNYSLGETSSKTLAFTMDVSLMDHQVKQTLGPVALFADMNNADVRQTFQMPSNDHVDAGTPTLKDLCFSGNGFVYTGDATAAVEGDVSEWNRSFLWELRSPDFQHSTYAGLAAQKALELSTAIANRSGNEQIAAADYQVNPPYTPKIKKLSLSYTSALEVNLDGSHLAGDEAIYHQHPFGQSELLTQTGSDGVFFLPQYGNEGELYIGIKSLQPPQNIALLFQMAEGSADPDLPPDTISWHVLSANQWQSLQEGNLLSDTTRGLINSGIVRFSLPRALPNTLLPEDLYWIRASIPLNTRSVCDTVAIHTQAVSAVFVDANNDPGHLSEPLAVNSMTDLAIPMPQISAVLQPYTSFGGKAPEVAADFYTRVSERLRHKQRALTIWDYEHLVLAHFPEIYKVKCLPARFDAPGQIEMIVIPQIRNKRPFNPFEPKAPADLIADIATYLSDKHPPSAHIIVKNACYVAVKVRFGVRFKADVDARYYKQQINADLNRFLSPWAYEEGSDIVIGEKIYANSIINFLDQRPYVDYVVELKLFSSTNGVDFKAALPVENEGYYVTTDRPDGVLVATQNHEIDLVSATGYEENVFSGLHYMKTELDFIVG